MEIKTQHMSRVGIFSLSDICSPCPDTISDKQSVRNCTVFFLYQLLSLLLLTVPLSFPTPLVEIPIPHPLRSICSNVTHEKSIFKAEGEQNPKRLCVISLIPEPFLIFRKCNVFMAVLFTCRCFLFSAVHLLELLLPYTPHRIKCGIR